MEVRSLIWRLCRLRYIPDQMDDYSCPKSVIVKEMISVCLERDRILEFLNYFQGVDLTEKWIVVGNAKIRNGFYLLAVTYAINDILVKYVDEVYDLEQLLLSGLNITTEKTLNMFVEMKEAFEEINSLIHRIIENELHGCQILDLFVKTSSVSSSLEKILLSFRKCLNGEMLKQTKGLMLYGKLEDKFGEFFIKSIEEVTPSSSILFGSVSESSSMVSSIDCSQFLMNSMFTNLPFKLCLQDSNKEYVINHGFIPCHIPHSLVCRILSIGQFLVLLKHKPVEDLADLNLFLNISEYGLDEKEIESKFDALIESDVFEINDFEGVIGQIWIGLNKYLKKMVFEDGPFKNVFNEICDVYLMARGELWKDFLSHKNELLFSNVTQASTQSLNSALINSAEKFYKDNYEWLNGFKFVLPRRDSRQNNVLTVDVLRLLYKPSWPLHLIFSPPVLEDYNRIFIFLLKVKGVFLDLLSIVFDDIMCPSDGQSFLLKLEYLKHQFITVLSNLQYYIFDDVVHSERTKFEQLLDSSDSFHSIQKGHSVFLTNIVTQLFLPPNVKDSNFSNKCEVKRNTEEFGSSLVYDKITELLKMVRKFCCLVKMKRAETFEVDLTASFEKLINEIMSLSRNFGEKDSAEYLSKLMMRLDFNSFFKNSVT